MAALVDTNVLVYRIDSRFPAKQRIAADVLRRGIETETIRVAHQAVVEFAAVALRLIEPATALQFTENLLDQFVVLYPDERVVRAALRSAALYRLSWFDAHMLAYAEVFGTEELLSEDFEHGRRYGTVRVVNPFI